MARTIGVATLFQPGGGEGGSRANNCSGEGPTAASVGLHYHATSSHPILATPQQAGGGATEQCGVADTWHPWALLPSPAALARHLPFFLSFFFSVCFNFTVFPTLWEGAAAKNNVAKPRGLAHAAWSLQQQRRL